MAFLVSPPEPQSKQTPMPLKPYSRTPSLPTWQKPVMEEFTGKALMSPCQLELQWPPGRTRIGPQTMVPNPHRAPPWLSLKWMNKLKLILPSWPFSRVPVQESLVLTPTPGSAPQPGSAPSWILRGSLPKVFPSKASFLGAADQLVRDAAATFPGWSAGHRRVDTHSWAQTQVLLSQLQKQGNNHVSPISVLAFGTHTSSHWCFSVWC